MSLYMSTISLGTLTLEIGQLRQRVVELELENSRLQDLCDQRHVDAEVGRRMQQTTMYVSGTESGKRLHFFKKCARANAREVTLCGTCTGRFAGLD